MLRGAPTWIFTNILITAAKIMISIQNTYGYVLVGGRKPKKQSKNYNLVKGKQELLQKKR